MGSGVEPSAISVVCDAEGIIIFRSPFAPAREAVLADAGATDSDSDAWRGHGDDGSAAVTVGVPLVKTFAFDHLDCDVREIQQVMRRAIRGRPERLRVWLRVNEHQLVRVDLTATPLLDASGASRHVLIRTEPTHAASARRRDGQDVDDGPAIKPFRAAAAEHGTPATDRDSLGTILPLLPAARVEPLTAAVQEANDSFAALFDRARDACIGLPLSELLAADDRRPLARWLAEGSSSSGGARWIDVRMARPAGPRVVRLARAAPTEARGAASLLVWAQDVTAEHEVAARLRAAEADAAAALARAERARWLEQLVARADVGLALFEDAQVVHSNPACDAVMQTPDAASIDALVASAGTRRTAEEAVLPDGTLVVATSLADERRQVVGLCVRRPAGPHLEATRREDAFRRAIAASGRVAAFLIAADDGLVPLDADGPAARNVESIFDSATVRAFRAALARARASPADAAAADVVLREGGPRRVLLSQAGGAGAAVLMLLFDEVERIAERDALQFRVMELEEVIDALRRASVDADGLTATGRQAAEGHERFAQLAAAVGAGTFSWDIEAGVVEADQHARSLLALEPAADDRPLTPAKLLDAVSAEDRARFERALFDAMSPDEPDTLDVSLTCGPDARSLQIVGRVTFEARDASRDPAMLTGAVLDRSAERGAAARIVELDAALQLRTAELNALFEATPDALRLSRDNVVRHNAAAAGMLGDRVETPFGPPEAGKASAVESASASDADGQTRVILSSAAPIVVDGRVVGAVAFERDVTELHQLRTLSSGLEAQVAALFGNTGVGILFLDAAGRIAGANAHVAMLLGHTPPELVGNAVEAITFADDVVTVRGLFEAVRHVETSSCSADVRLLRRDGVPAWTQLTIASHGEVAGEFDSRGAGRGQTIFLLVQDAHALHAERAHAAELEASLTELRVRHERMTAASTEGYAVLDATLNVLEANDAARRLLRLDSADGNAFEHVRVHGPDRTAIATAKLPWHRALRGKATRAELRFSPAGVGVDEGDAPATIVVDCNAAPAAETRRVVLTLRDLTDRHAMQDELNRTYARVVEAHTLLQQRTQQLEGMLVSAVQQLQSAAAVAAPAARALVAEPRLPAQLRPAAQQIADVLRVHSRLVHHYTDGPGTAASATRAVRNDCDVHALAHEALRWVAARFNVAGRLIGRLPATAATVHVDAAIVRHALGALFAHAAGQASRGPAVVTSTPAPAADRAAGVRLLVSWPGKGAQAAEVTLARSLIEAEGGTLALETTDGQTTASTWLPLAVESRGEAAIAIAPLRVLLVEDHDSTARVLSRQLARLRCAVTVASTLQEAEAALGRGPSFELLVCDLGLPDGSALDFARRVTRRAGHALPAIALRGFGGADHTDASLRSAGFIAQLSKPIDLNALAKVIAGVSRG